MSKPTDTLPKAQQITVEVKDGNGRVVVSKTYKPPAQKAVNVRASLKDIGYEGDLLDGDGDTLIGQDELVSGQKYELRLHTQPGALVFPAAYGSPHKGINARHYRTARHVLSEQVFAVDVSFGACLIKAPAKSGKTSAMQLAVAWARQQHPGLNALYINMADLGRNPDLDKELLGMLGVPSFAELIRRGQPWLICLDEAQLAFKEASSGSQGFWGFVKKLLRGHEESKAAQPPQQPPQVRVIIAAAYGSKRSGASSADSESPMGTPVSLDDPNIVVTVFTSPSGASLCLSMGEWDELWTNFMGFSRLALGSSIKAHIARMTALQVGLVTACLDYLLDTLKNELRQPDVIDRNALYKLTSPGFLHCLLRDARSIMLYKDIENVPGAVDVLRRLLWGEPLLAHQWDDTSTVARAARRLLRLGEVVLEDTLDGSRLHFTSPLHRAVFMHQHFKGACYRTTDWTVLDLVIRLVERMDPHILRESKSLASDARRLERCWQMEMYRALLTCLPSHRVVSPDVGKALGAHGFADCFVGEPECIVLEATRDGKGLKDHLGRFLDPAKYEPFFAQGAVRLHGVIDFRDPIRQAKPCVQHEHLYTVLFLPGYGEAQVWHQGHVRTVMVSGQAGEGSTEALRAVLT